MRSMSTYSKEILFRITVRLSEAVQSRSERSEQIGEALALCRRARILEVQIYAVESIVLDELQRTADERGTLVGICDEAEMTILGICPASDGEGNFQIPVGSR